MSLKLLFSFINAHVTPNISSKLPKIYSFQQYIIHFMMNNTNFDYSSMQVYCV